MIPAPDLDAIETAITDRLMTLENPSITPAEPLLRSVFNLIDEAMRDDDSPKRMPAVGILHESEDWDADELIGPDVSQQGRERWTLIVLVDAAKRDGGIRGPRGARNVSRLVMQSLNGWQIVDGCPITVERRRRYDVRSESGELLPIAGYVIEISHPVDYATELI